MDSKKKVIRIVRKSGINYTFLDIVSMDIKLEPKSDPGNIDSNTKKDVRSDLSTLKNQKFDIKTE